MRTKPVLLAVVLSATILLSVFFASFSHIMAGGKSDPHQKKTSLRAKQDRKPAQEITDLYRAKCSMCHGKNGEGSSMMAKMMKFSPDDLRLDMEKTKRASDSDLINTILNGRGKMPSFKNTLKESDAQQLVDHIRSFIK